MTPRVVIAGGGVAAVELILALRDLADDRVEVELLAPEADFTYRPLAVGKPFEVAEVPKFSLDRIATENSVKCTKATLAGVDVDQRFAVTAEGRRVPYNFLVVATGARPREALPGAITFKREADSGTFHSLLEDIEAGVGRVAFAVPGGAAWPLPLYELALMTATYASTRRLENVHITLVTPESEPLTLFGAEPSRAVARLLADARIELRLATRAAAVYGQKLVLIPGPDIAMDRVVTLPRLHGPHIPGLPADSAGFIPTDAHGRVEGAESVYAAGDATTFPIKQGGIATQQADAVAEHIAAAAGAPLEPRAFEPVLRGLLLTGGPPAYLRDGPQESRAEVEPLWWPPSKIAGRYLSRYVARLTAVDNRPDGVMVEVDDLERVIAGS